MCVTVFFFHIDDNPLIWIELLLPRDDMNCIILTYNKMWNVVSSQSVCPVERFRTWWMIILNGKSVSDWICTKYNSFSTSFVLHVIGRHNPSVILWVWRRETSYIKAIQMIMIKDQRIPPDFTPITPFSPGLKVSRAKLTEFTPTRKGGNSSLRWSLSSLCHSMNPFSILRHWSASPIQYILPENVPHVRLPSASITESGNLRFNFYEHSLLVLYVR